MPIKKHLKQFLLVSSVLLLTSCGGGSSSGGSMTTPNPGGGSNSNPTITGLPSLVSLEYDEASQLDALGNGPIFQINVTDPNQDPTNFRLVGDDGDFFEVEVRLAQSGSGSNDFELTLATSIISELDFENPSDIGADNIYNFDLAFDYAGSGYAIPFEVTILDIAENVRINLGFFKGLGKALKLVPDYSGDANPELLLGDTDRSEAVLSSESIESNKNSVASFFEDLLTTSRDAETATSDIQSFDMVSNSFGGVDVLVKPSISGSDTKLFDLRTANDFEILRGTITSSIEHPSQILYNFSEDGGYFSPDFYLTSDLNADGINDLVYTLRTKQDEFGSIRLYAITFGKPTSDESSDRKIIIEKPDVLLNLHPSSFPNVNGAVEIFRIPDLDGDGLEELIIYDRSADGIDGSDDQRVTEGVYTFLYSMTLNSGNAEIDLWNLEAGQGFQLYDSFSGRTANRALNSLVTMGSDYDNDGTDSVIIPFPDGVFVADQDELASLSSSSDVRLQSNFLVFEDGFLNTPTPIGDLDGDGQDEIMFDRGIIYGRQISENLLNGNTELDIDETLNINYVVSGNANIDRIIDMPDQGLIALSGFNGTLLLERAELEVALNQPITGLTFDEAN